MGYMGNIGVIWGEYSGEEYTGNIEQVLGCHRGYIGIMDKKMETIIMGYSGFRIYRSFV